MRVCRVPVLLSIVLLVVIALGAVMASAARVPTTGAGVPALCAPRDTYVVYLPMVAKTSGAIIIDHNHTDLTRIPNEWLTRAKLLTFHYGHTSHGSQINSGIVWLETQDSKYNVDIRYGGAPALPPDTTALRIYDGNNYGGNTYITPDMYWESADGISHTQSVAVTGLFGFSMWSWCGQMSSYSTAQVQQYLDTLNQLEQQYPGMRFIYMTGHTDGTAPGSTLHQNNDLVRQYVRDHNKVLFDFADIETYDPAGGGPYDNNSEGTCQWCATWCAAHPADCASLPGDCAHSSSPTQARLFCKLKGQAFWWMMARLAGWDGVSP